MTLTLVGCASVSVSDRAIRLSGALEQIELLVERRDKVPPARDASQNRIALPA